MQVSARNALKGTVKNVIVGSVNTEVTIEVAPGVEMTAIITKSSAENLKLTEGKEVHAIVKSSDVIIAID
ncbi:MAG: molybdopterin-binding protein [Nostoc sp.]|uniref:TOBE domain-containing protein n=1 Tax=Nostoc sp. TaxID=1180 RepID=UPI002FF527A3